MKKIFMLACAMVGLVIFASCSDSEFDKQYIDTSKTTTAGVPQVFTGILHKGNTWMNPTYYRYYVQSTTSGTFSGVIGTNNSRGRFRGASEGYFNTRWQNFYDMLTQYRVLEYTYNNLSEAEKAANEIFYYLGRTVMEAQLHEVVSLWGDVPYTGAGTLWRTSNYSAAKEAAVYDDDKGIYATILSDLKAVGDYFAAGNLNATGVSALKRQDITVAVGSTDIWQRYVNSLRLRIALHLATNGDMTTQAREAIAEILNNPTTYPLIETNAQNIGVDGDTNTDTYNYGKAVSQALSGNSYASGSQTMLNAMNIPSTGIPDANSDPRIEAIYDCNPDGEYVAYNDSLTESQISSIADEKNVEYVKRGIKSANYYCYIDSIAVAGYATYQGNSNLNGIWISAAEVALSKAECYLMGYGVTADAATAKTNFINGVTLSNEYYWTMKLNSSLTTSYTAPVTTTSATGAVTYTSYGYFNDSYQGVRKLMYNANLTSTDATSAKTELLAYIATTSQSYAQSIWDATQECVATQLWLNFGFMNELEAWNVTRRTGYPTVKFARDTQISDYPTPPNRLPYPSDELNYNSTNVQNAIKTNYSESTGYYTNLFWAKETYYSLY